MTPSVLPRRRPRPWLGAALATLAVVTLTLGAGVLAAPPAAAAGSGVTLSTTIDGQAVAGSSASHPVKLYPNRPAVIDILVTNYRTRTITVDSVSLNGTVAGLTFYAYDTSVHLLLGSHRATHLRYALDLAGLDGQATGLIPATISIANPRHQQLASQSLVTDVQGSLDSVYGLFGLALLVLTALAIIGVVVSIATHRMPPNRWRRGLRMLTPGIGIGLVLVFSMSALSVWVPTAGTWLIVVLVFAVVFFVLGYLTPNPTVEGEDDEDDDDLYLRVTPESEEAETPTVQSPPGTASPDEAPPPPPPAPATIATPAVGEPTPGDESPA